jgi:hypothetical protein
MQNGKAIEVFLIVINIGIKAEDAEGQKDHEEGVRPLDKTVPDKDKDNGKNHDGNRKAFVRPHRIPEQDEKSKGDREGLQEDDAIHVKKMIGKVIDKTEEPVIIRERLAR